MSKHTPGPWEWWTSNSWRRLRSNPSNGRDVGVCVPFVASDGHPDLEVSSADMNLIAAAPELLDTVKALVDTHDCSDFATPPCEHCDAALALIRRIEGVK